MALGARVEGGNTHFAVRSPHADMIWLCLFGSKGETRHPMVRDGAEWSLTLAGDLSGERYGYRAAGEWAPERGRWFDPSKLLVDPYAVQLDRRFQQNPGLSGFGQDTAPIVPRAVVQAPMPCSAVAPPHFTHGGLIYEINVRSFTMLHPDVPEQMGGTIGALAHPSILAHLRKLKIMAVELMPIVAWIDERHLPALGLVNSWGYNPVAMMALDPGLCPGGVAELRDTVATLHAHGIGVLLDLVFNHSGESDSLGGVLSLRGLDDAMYAHAADGGLINDTGCGNTLDFGNGAVRRLVLNTLRHFVKHCGVDGFRFDLAPVLARGPDFDPAAPIFAEIAQDSLLADRIMIAEPWDVGPGGYQLGRFPPNWLEWNDRFRDDVRRFWRGDGGVGTLATRLAGSSDIFGSQAVGSPCRSVNFLAAHDGFTLADTVSYQQRHNWANGEANRDGHSENFSWNNGAEGETQDLAVLRARRADVKALLGTLFASVGTIMLTAGDEFGRTQHGNNNAYCQDNPLTWLDWRDRDQELEDFVAALSAHRSERLGSYARLPEPVVWLRQDGNEMSYEDWEHPGAGWLHCRSLAQDACYDVSIDRFTRKVTFS
ncbi:glycogen debranching protein GlgX [Novosphingobium panipatense]|uniref:Glycogen operon protein n=1 Tax=Novosphingobium panipatense TaxID=428991 RepID=A0ABY1QTB3_9SPHN|nr:glycogen debranching protein GlgX [Novosphingobium panipatense]SMP78568.1 glycogen operon protein [Novosphingobium panipatense]